MVAFIFIVALVACRIFNRKTPHNNYCTDGSFGWTLTVGPSRRSIGRFGREVADARPQHKFAQTRVMRSIERVTGITFLSSSDASYCFVFF
jgi:hypothetical protein